MKINRAAFKAVAVALLATAILATGVVGAAYAIDIDAERFTGRSPTLEVTSESPYTVKYQVGAESGTVTIMPLSDTTLRMTLTVRQVIHGTTTSTADAVLNSNDTITATATGPSGPVTRTSSRDEAECGVTRCALVKAAGMVINQAMCTGYSPWCIIAKGTVSGSTYLYCYYVGCDGLECEGQIDLYDTTGVWPDSPGRALDVVAAVYCTDQMQRIDIDWQLYRGSTAVGNGIRKACFYKDSCTDYWTVSRLQKDCYDALMWWSAEWVHPATGEKVTLGGNLRSNKVCFAA